MYENKKILKISTTITVIASFLYMYCKNNYKKNIEKENTDKSNNIKL